MPEATNTLNLKKNLAKGIFQAHTVMYYFPDFISVEDEKRLLETIESAPKSKWDQTEFFKQDWGRVYHSDGRVRLDGGEMPDVSFWKEYIGFLLLGSLSAHIFSSSNFKATFNRDSDTKVKIAV